MSINDERMKIPNKISDGKITSEADSGLLLATVEGQGSISSAPNRPPSGLMVHKRVVDVSSARSNANVQLPLSVVEAGMKLGARFIPDGDDPEISRFMNAIRWDVPGKVVDIADQAGGEHVEIFIG